MVLSCNFLFHYYRDPNLKGKILETKPKETYWAMAEKNGFNFERKGSRKVNENGSKHKLDITNRIGWTEIV
ncbi:MAG TPA: hypothetical protein VIK78_08740 [Ruminiclostridium sp.]